MEAQDIIVIGVIKRELAKEGVGDIQSERIGKAVVRALKALYVTNSATNRYL
jgi:transcriptional regulator NrdR family protein